jgi:hypothetical protein
MSACRGAYAESDLIGTYEDEIHVETLTLMAGGVYDETLRYLSGQEIRNAGRWSLEQTPGTSTIVLQDSALMGHYSVYLPAPQPKPQRFEFRLEASQAFGDLTLNWGDEIRLLRVRS